MRSAAGVADMYHSYDGYFERKSPALNFFCGVPFGFTANELFAWVRYGGGQELWDVLSGQFNIKPLLCLSTGDQMGGWFNARSPRRTEYKGLRYRMAGLGAEVLRRLGAIVVTLPGGEIVSALKSGAIDASEWIGPWLDMAIGLHKAARYYYYPGFHEPGTAQTLGINKRVWESFDARRPAADRGLRRRRIRANTGGVQQPTTHCRCASCATKAPSRILKFDNSMLKTFHEISREVRRRGRLRRRDFPGRSTGATSSSAL